MIGAFAAADAVFAASYTAIAYAPSAIAAVRAAQAVAKGAAAAKAALNLVDLGTKIGRQVLSRGWTTQEILDTVQNGKEYPAINNATGGPATEFVNSVTGRFVVVDNVTGQILQVSRSGMLPNHLLR